MLVLFRLDYLIYKEDPSLAFAAKLMTPSQKTALVALCNKNLLLKLSHDLRC